MTVILIVGGLFFATMLAPVIQMLTIAFLLAFLLFIPARTLTRRVRLPYTVSVIVVYLILIVVIIASILLLIPAMVDGVESLSNGFRDGVARLETELEPYLQDGVNTVNIFGVDLDIAFILDPVRQALGAYTQITQAEELEVPGEDSDTPSTVGPTAPTRPTVSLGSSDLRAWIDSLFSLAGTVTETLTSAIAGVTGLITGTLLALFISFLVLLDIPTSARTLDRWVPDTYNREYSLLVHKIVRVWNGFFKGQVIIGVMIGILTWLQLSLMGVAQPAVLAVTIGAISLIPTIGGFIALVPLAIVPLLNGSSVFTTMPNGFFALFVIVVNLFISQIIWNVVAPKILGDALDLPLPVIIVGVFIGAAVGGILGAFLVAPIMGTLRHIVLYVIAKINMRDPFPGEEAPFVFGEPMFPQSEQVHQEIKPPTRATQGGR
jgi:predicted PurR-regulated permease PerM